MPISESPDEMTEGHVIYKNLAFQKELARTSERVDEIMQQPTGHPMESMIPRISDEAANQANIASIDRLVQTETHRHIVAWGKFLGFTPETVLKYVQEAEADNAPIDAIQKIDGRWLCVADIANESNRQMVNELACK